MNNIILCLKCRHQQTLFEPTLKKLRSYGHRIVRCSKCHCRIRLLWRKGYVETDHEA